MADHGLVVDVGMHDGEDTAYYLAKGLRVLAIEANPDLCTQTADQMAEHVASGQLEILNVAVTEVPGEVTFHISDRAGWGSIRSEWAESRRELGVESRAITVPADTLSNILAGRDVPHYVKIDVEGADAACVRSLRGAAMPAFISVEVDPMDGAESLSTIAHLEEYGYTRFKLVNQVHNPDLRCPHPPLEGDYVNARFSHYSSGLFGEETPGEWVSIAEVREQYEHVCRQQAVRAGYTASGKVFGIPLGRFHRQLEVMYNARPVRRARFAYARARGVEVGGWFDLHASR